MAIMLANDLADVTERSALCATRVLGPLASSVSPAVRTTCLERRGRIGFRSIGPLRSLISNERINVVQAHGSSVYFTALALVGRRRPALIWHDHNSRLGERSARLARLGSMFADRVFVVSEDVRQWHLAAGTPPHKVEVFPNFVTIGEPASPADDLPGAAGERVVVVGNLRPEKNHVGTVRAIARVASIRPTVHLLCAGSTANDEVVRGVLGTASELGVADRVSLLGVRTDVAEVLAGCDVGVLFSLAEGFPVALLEYGRAGLPAVASDVGHVGAVAQLTQGVRVVAPGDEQALADEILELLGDPELRENLGGDFQNTVKHRFSAEAVIPTVLERYRAVMTSRARSSGRV
jgi:glycosyltransferase involved in cell wall biosynthesis